MCPTINKLPRKPKSTYHNNTDNRELRKKAYNDSRWRKVRQTYIQNHPLCEECLKEGKVYAGTLDDPLQVHHKKHFIVNGKIDYDLFLDSTNLETICSKCHAKIHNEEQGFVAPETVIKQLDELLNNE